ncbi:RHS repeat domain-containing protein [Stieleria sp. JC731]|uniref:RHS repeat domain-containing protein n=1 Tax=Pirellulaceae TaxID=2691357 RepID=UPI003965781E
MTPKPGATSHDGETGLQYFRDRYYHTGRGRFCSRDPIAYRNGKNLRSYVGDSPLKFLGPRGLEQNSSLVIDTGSFGEGMVIVGFPPSGISSREAANCFTQVYGEFKTKKAGFVVCCKGKEVACASIPKSDSMQADAILAVCIREHEKTR